MRTLTRDRRTIVWSSFVWVAQNVGYGFRLDFARIFAETWLEFGDGVTMGRPSNHPPEGKNQSSEGQKSMSDRLGDSQEQSKSPEDDNFEFCLTFFPNSGYENR